MRRTDLPRETRTAGPGSGRARDSSEPRRKPGPPTGPACRQPAACSGHSRHVGSSRCLQRTQPAPTAAPSLRARQRRTTSLGRWGVPPRGRVGFEHGGRQPRRPSRAAGRSFESVRRGGAHGLLARSGSNRPSLSGPRLRRTARHRRFGANRSKRRAPQRGSKPKGASGTGPRQRGASATDSLVEQGPEVEQQSSKVQPRQRGGAARSSRNGERAQNAATREGCQRGKSFEG